MQPLSNSPCVLLCPCLFFLQACTALFDLDVKLSLSTLVWAGTSVQEANICSHPYLLDPVSICLVRGSPWCFYTIISRTVVQDAPLHLSHEQLMRCCDQIWWWSKRVLLCATVWSQARLGCVCPMEFAARCTSLAVQKKKIMLLAFRLEQLAAILSLPVKHISSWRHTAYTKQRSSANPLLTWLCIYLRTPYIPKVSGSC